MRARRSEYLCLYSVEDVHAGPGGGALEICSEFGLSEVQKGPKIFPPPAGASGGACGGPVSSSKNHIAPSRPRTASGPAARDKTFKKSQNPPWLALTVAGAGGKKKQTTEVQYAAGQKWGLDPDIDHDTRVVCEGT